MENEAGWRIGLEKRDLFVVLQSWEKMGLGRWGGDPKTSSHPLPKGFVIYRNAPVPPNLQRSDLAASHRIKK